MTHRAASAVAALLSASLILLHVLVHRDAGGWIAKGATRDTVTLEGHLVEWEWIHVAATAALLDPRRATLDPMSTQDAFRYVPGLLVGALRGPAGGIYLAALIATLVLWAAAAATLASMASAAWLRSDTPSHANSTLALVAGAVLVTQGAGYIAFLGNVDAHQVGYAAVALTCGAWFCFQPDRPAAASKQAWRAVAMGLSLSAAGYAMEVSYPLLLSALLLLGAATWWRELSVRDAARQALLITGSFAAPYLAFRLVMQLALGPNLVSLNDPLQQLGGHLQDMAARGLLPWLAGRIGALADRWFAAFPAPVSVLAAIGVIVLPSRWRRWAVLTLLPLLLAVGATKLLVRTIYLAHPPIYVLAAGGAAWLSARVGGRLGRSPAVSWLTLAAILVVVTLVTNADLWGDYDLPTRWWGTQ